MSESDLYLNDIKRMIKSIEETTKGKSFNDFLKDPNLSDASTLRLQIIGESIKKLSKKSKKKHLEIWRNFEKTRDVISHDYFTLNPQIIWDKVTIELPELKKFINKTKW
jgi:uncharacterized protein with HEPN domain